METRKLYYEDSLLRSFDAFVLSCDKTERGYEIVLDATAFYPTGGGQACDTGFLNDAAVTDVFERGQQVIHLCDRPLTGTVTGRIDWDGRFERMQQHAGEHIVSGIICRRYGCHNVGFHMGSDVITIDFDAPVPAEDLADIEREANAVVEADLPIRGWYPDPEALKTIPYRSKKALDWPVRIVEIPGIDDCACCGVHVPNTLRVGVIKLFSCVKFHQGVRIEMACGRRALGILNQVYDQNRQVSQAFSAKLLETGEAARKMNARLADAEYRCASLQKQVFAAIADGYAGKENVLHFGDLTPAQTRELAEMILPRTSGSVLVCGGEAGKYSFCLASHGDGKAQGSALCAALNGRGGGKPPFFQGSLNAVKAQIEEYWK